MKVRFLGETSFLVLTKNKEYDVISIEKDWYRIIDDSGEDYLYSPKSFEIVEDDRKGSLTKTIYGDVSKNKSKNDSHIAVAGK